MKNERVIKNFAYNTAYQILVLVAPLITTPYVSRVLGATNLGVYGYTQSIASYFVLVGAVGTNLYGQREIAYLQDKPTDRTKAFWEIEVFRLVTVSVCTLIYTTLFCSIGKYPLIYGVLTIEVIATAFDISWLFMGMENFRVIVLRNTIIKLVGIICVFLFVKTKDDLAIYTICVTAPLLLGNISLWFSLKKYLVKVHFAPKELLNGIIIRLRPVFVLFLPQVAMDVYLVLDKTMIGMLGSSIDQVGYYTQAQKIVKLVLTIVTSLGTVMLPAMSASFARGDHEEILRSIKTAFKTVYLLSFSLLFGLCAIAPRFVPFFFGPGYDPVVLLMIVISPILVIIATSNVIGKQYLLPTAQQTAFTISILAGAGVNFILNLILIRQWDAIGASIATVLAELAVTGVQCIYVRKQLPLRICFASGVRYLIMGLIMFLIVKGVDLILPPEKYWAIGIMVAVGIVVYIGELIITNDPILNMCLGLIKSKQ